MELTFAWYWIINLTLLSVTLLTTYKAVYQHRFESKFWLIAMVAMLILSIFKPIKIGVDMGVYQDKQTQSIECSKVLPELVRDDSFNQAKALKGIQIKDK